MKRLIPLLAILLPGIVLGQPAGAERRWPPLIPSDLLRNPAVQDELKLTAHQRALASAPVYYYHPKPGESTKKAFGVMHQRELDHQRKALEAMSAAQRRRARELGIQRWGLAALAWPEVASELHLSAVQKTRLQALRKDEGVAIARAGPPYPSKAISQEDLPDIMADYRAAAKKAQPAVEKLRQAYREKMLATLSPAQRRKWELMQGKPFKLLGKK